MNRKYQFNLKYQFSLEGRKEGWREEGERKRELQQMTDLKDKFFGENKKINQHDLLLNKGR